MVFSLLSDTFQTLSIIVISFLVHSLSLHLLELSALLAVSGAAIIALVGLWPAIVKSDELPARQPRALCIGMGGGSLPMFLAHHFPGMQVTVSLQRRVIVICTE